MIPEILHDFETHRKSWRDAILAAQEAEPLRDDKAYWQHELGAYDKAMTALDGHFNAENMALLEHKLGGAMQQRDLAYNQRNSLAIAFASAMSQLGFKAGYAMDNDPEREDWDVNWRTIVYVELGAGEQISYHMNDDTGVAARELPKYPFAWNGKYTGRDAPGWLKLLSFVPAKPGMSTLVEEATKADVDLAGVMAKRLTETFDMCDNIGVEMQSLLQPRDKAFTSKLDFANISTVALPAAQPWGKADILQAMIRLNEELRGQRPAGLSDLEWSVVQNMRGATGPNVQAIDYALDVDVERALGWGMPLNFAIQPPSSVIKMNVDTGRTFEEELRERRRAVTLELSLRKFEQMLTCDCHGGGRECPHDEHGTPHCELEDGPECDQTDSEGGEI